MAQPASWRGGAEAVIFAVSSLSRLDGVPLQQRLEIPRKLLRPEHGLDTNVFVFTLEDPADLSRFQKYDVVELIP